MSQGLIENIREKRSVMSQFNLRGKIISILIVAFAFPIAFLPSAPATPTFISTSFTSPENVETVTALTLANVVPNESQTVWGFQDGVSDDREVFNINPATGLLSFKVAPNFEARTGVASGYLGSGGNVYVVAVSATVDGGTPITNNVTVTVTNHNWIYEGPTSFNIYESATAVGTVGGVYQNYSNGSQSISGETFTILDALDGEFFTINEDSGVLTLNEISDFESKESYTVRVEIALNDDSFVQNLVVDVENWDLTGLGFSPGALSSKSIFETSTAVGNLTVSKADTDTVEYFLEEGGADNDAVEVSAAGVVTLDNASDKEVKDEFSIKVKAVSTQTGESITADLTIVILDSGPIVQWTNWSTTGESSTTRIVVGESSLFVDTITAFLAGSSVGGIVAYSFQDGENDNALFDLNETGTVSFKNLADNDYELGQLYSIEVVATDSFGESTTATLAVEIGERGPDQIRWASAIGEDSTTVIIKEWSNFVDTLTGTTLGDYSGPLTFSLAPASEGNANVFFLIGSDSVTVTFAADFKADFESTTAYVIDVIATDALGETKTATLNVEIEDNGPEDIQFARGAIDPLALGLCAVNFSFGVLNGAEVETPTTAVCENYVGSIDTVTATADDGNYSGTLSYSLGSSFESGQFSIDSVTGVLSTNRNLVVGQNYNYFEGEYPVGFDYEFPVFEYGTTWYGSYRVEVLVSDGYETETIVMEVAVNNAEQVAEFSPSSVTAAGGPGKITVTIGRPEGLLARTAALQQLMSGNFDNYYDMYGPGIETLQLLDQAQGWRYTVEYAPYPVNEGPIQWTSASLVNVANALLETQTAVITGLDQGEYIVRVGYADLFGGTIFNYYGPGYFSSSCSIAAMYGEYAGPKNLTPGLYLANYCYRVMATSEEGELLPMVEGFYDFGWSLDSVTVLSATPVQGPQGIPGPAPVIIFNPVVPAAPNTLPSATSSQNGETVTVTLTIPVGETGTAGLQGPKGETGTAGAAGLNGATGLTGPQGPAGANGANGASGPVGPQGPKGETGTAGTAGPSGPVGPQGPKGDTGPQGPAGPKGATSIFGVISFTNASASLKASDIRALRNAGIKKDAIITVGGYTSKAGSAVLNQRLSKQRADSIAKQIRSILPKVNVRTIGYGEKINKACTKLQNRCVVISVTQPANS